MARLPDTGTRFIVQQLLGSGRGKWITCERANLDGYPVQRTFATIEGAREFAKRVDTASAPARVVCIEGAPLVERVR